MTRRTRPALAALVAAAALGLGLIALGARGGGPAVADAQAHPAHAATTPRAVALRMDMRRLWEEHITWTRQVVVDFAAGLPSLPASETRLLRNQADIGDAVAPFYGRAAGRRLTGLLREHILIAVDVLTAAKAGDATALARAQARWTGNGDRIAGFLATADPAHWPRREMRGMMRRHLALTTDEAVARLTGDFAADVRAYDAVQRQALDMADMLSSGIVARFPARFGAAG
jgi:hypothetical protein